MEARRFSDLSDEQLDEMLKEARAKASLLEDEKIIRSRERKEKAWLDLIEMIEEYNKNYGTIIIEGRDDDGNLASFHLENMDTSTLGIIDVT